MRPRRATLPGPTGSKWPGAYTGVASIVMADDSGSDEGNVPEERGGGDTPNPFSAFPMFGDIARALQGQGPLNWDAARQFALLGATEGAPEHNVDPAVRITYAALAQIAGMHVNDVTGSDTVFPEPRIVTRGQWT